MSQPLCDTADLALTGDAQVTYASAWVRAYCGWHIYPSQDDTVTVNTAGGQLLLLPTLYMTALGPVILTADSSTVDPTTLSWSQNGSVAYKPCQDVWPQPCWPVGLSTVTVTFTHGYDEVPDAIKAVTVAIAKRMLSQLSGVQSEQAGMVLRTYADADVLSPAESAALNRYRLWP